MPNLSSQSSTDILKRHIDSAWKKLNLCWPIENIIASNPLYGMEELPFEESLKLGSIYYNHLSLPEKMHNINRESIKWCMVYYDEGQASIPMPDKQAGIFAAWKKLVRHDSHTYSKAQRKILRELGNDPLAAIHSALTLLDIHKEHWELFITLTLSTLPGWSGYVKTRSTWPNNNPTAQFRISMLDYLAFRITLVSLHWASAKELIYWHEKQKYQHQGDNLQLQAIKSNEQSYKADLLTKLDYAINNQEKCSLPVSAQFVFCIDVRSEPMRRAIESLGKYQTFGFAGFFGIPLKIRNGGKNMNACPVLLEPTIDVTIERRPTIYSSALKRTYLQLKYSYTTPFILAEVLGPWLGACMLVNNFFPTASKYFAQLKSRLLSNKAAEPELQISADDQLETECQAAVAILRAIDLTHSFSKMIILCGHSAETTNNAHASALDCGACGGNPGGINALTLATILNKKEVRTYLVKNGIFIPDETRFYAAEHNTTTDEIVFMHERLDEIERDLRSARLIANNERLIQLAPTQQAINPSSAAKYLVYRSKDWSQPRPEWGLAGNAAMIIGDRDLTRSINLHGRAFLHSYNWQTDQDSQILNTILTAPVIVAYWINTQYFFSAIDNVNYGSGSKITQNISGKIGIIQGNGSDLMHGLPWQSVYAAEEQIQHTPQRLLIVIHAPRHRIKHIIENNDQLLRLVKNEWIYIVSIDPEEDLIFDLLPTLEWRLYLHDYQHRSLETICT